MSNPLFLVALVCGFFVLLIGGLFYNMYRTAKKGRDNYARAVPASAKIVKIGKSYTSRNFGTVDVKLTIEVIPPAGPSYELSTTWFVEPASISKLKEGETYKIKIDPKDPKKVYSAEDWAQAMGQESEGAED
jgi:hypothetical protein